MICESSLQRGKIKKGDRMKIIQAIQGNAFYSTDFDTVKYIHNGLFCYDELGVITKVLETDDSDYEKTKKNIKNVRVLSNDEIILPGFVDLHIHAPQYPQAGIALDRPLELWLNDYTFPLESKYSDLVFAKKVYTDVVNTTLKHGTTTAVYFATVDRKSSVLLAKLCGELGQRGFVGKVAMDDELGCPSYYKDKNAIDAAKETEKFVLEVLNLQEKYHQKVYPVITPRFIPSCTTECLEAMGQLAKKYNTHIQTHASESDWAHQYAKDKYKMTDVEALITFGLITNKTIIAHAPFLEENDLKILKETGCSIAHSPLSNAYFANAVLPVKAFKTKGARIGLATDVSGGFSPSMYQSIRQAVTSSRMLESGVDPLLSNNTRGRKHSAITFNNALYLATVAGGEALDLPLGKLEKGYMMDIQILNLNELIPSYIKPKQPIDILHKALLLSESSNIKEVWVQGKKINK